MKLTIINNVVINLEYIEFVEKQNDGQSIVVCMNSGDKLSFKEDEAKNLMYWLNQIILKGCRG